VRPLRITKKRIVVSTPALEEFLTGFTEDLVDATRKPSGSSRTSRKPPRIRMGLDTHRDLVSPRSHVPQGGYASQVLIGNRAGTLTIVRGYPTSGELDRMRPQSPPSNWEI
jgi:hypothetical protein